MKIHANQNPNFFFFSKFFYAKKQCGRQFWNAVRKKPPILSRDRAKNLVGAWTPTSNPRPHRGYVVYPSLWQGPVFRMHSTSTGDGCKTYSMVANLVPRDLKLRIYAPHHTSKSTTPKFQWFLAPNNLANRWYFDIGLIPTYGHADPPSPQKCPLSKSDYEWCAVFWIEREE